MGAWPRCRFSAPHERISAGLAAAAPRAQPTYGVAVVGVRRRNALADTCPYRTPLIFTIRHTLNTRALRCRFAFRRGSYYSKLSCSAEQYNTQGAVAQLVERFVRIEEVVVSTTISSTKAFRNSTSGRLFSFPVPYHAQRELTHRANYSSSRFHSSRR